MHSVGLLIKPSSSLCNMNCKYCFYNDISQKREKLSFGFMSEQTLENVIKEGIRFADRELSIAFQGGEPTLIGLDFYKKALALEKKHNTKGIIISNSLQTNGYDISGEMAEFFRDNDFLIGVSLDGTRQTHDYNRKSKNGGSFDEVMKTIRLFDEKNVQYNILTVVNNQTAKCPSEIYSFYKENGFKYLQFIPCIEPYGSNNNSFLDAEEYGKFLVDIFNLWYEDLKQGNEVYIRQFENYVEMLLGMPPESCGMSGVCSYLNVVEANGNVYPCDFYVMDEYFLGNLNFNTFDEINRKRLDIGFIQASSKVDEKCKKCKYFALCRGGCRRYRRVDENGELTLNILCREYEIFFENCLDKLIEIAKQIQKKYGGS